MFATRYYTMSVHERELRNSGGDSSPNRKKEFAHTPNSSVRKGITNDVR